MSNWIMGLCVAGLVMVGCSKPQETETVPEVDEQTMREEVERAFSSALERAAEVRDDAAAAAESAVMWTEEAVEEAVERTQDAMEEAFEVPEAPAPRPTAIPETIETQPVDLDPAPFDPFKEIEQQSVETPEVDEAMEELDEMLEDAADDVQAAEEEDPSEEVEESEWDAPAVY